jgi:hypothetical protein
MRKAPAVAVLILGTLGLSSGDDERRPIDFNRDVRPILTENCFACHGPSKKDRQAGLRLDVREGALADLGGYAAIVPGKAEASALVERITSKDRDERMPPAKTRKTLTPQQIHTLVEWIRQGAVYAPHWAYVPPKRLEPPRVKDPTRVRNFVDGWILARLEQERLAPSPEADRRTLLRRLSFDLTGLPPDPAEVEAFVADPDPRAYEKRVDRLLASPHYGERMAVYWLDLVRYADTVGYHGDQEHNISPYRDWVIDAFNDNLPFDRFTTEQLAGDLLPGPTLDQKIATGYNRVLQTSHEGGVQAKEYLAMYGADRVRNFSGVWLGATLGCAQCHDHKYDPFTAEDHYSLTAFFADLDEDKHLRGGGTDTNPTQRAPEIPVLHRLERAELAGIEERLKKLEGQEGAELSRRAEAIRKNARLTMVAVAVPPRPIRVLPRGNWLDDTGKLVQPAVPHFLPQPPDPGRRLTRLDLARWLTSREGGIAGLTARVFANRLWYLFFGAGLSRVLDDLGGQGEPPSHPELLDALAVEFVESGWDVKHMVRLLVTSSAYRQSSLVPPGLGARDPENRLFARQSRFRLPAEAIRDNALAVSGLLVRKLHGRPVRPYQPEGYYRHLNFPARTYKADAGEDQYRRGVYMHWQRQFLHPAMLAFDAPRREECTAQRPISNTPLGALALLNDPVFVEAARAFAARILAGGRTFEERLDFAFRAALSRPPAPEEVATLRTLVAEHEREFRADPKAAAELQKAGQYRPPKELDPAELGAWTSAARAILNLNEAITRN